MKTLDAGGVRFAYESHGAGPAIVFLHGLPTDHRSISIAAEGAFDESSKWTRIYPDLPGTGATKANPAAKTADAYAGAIDAFVDAIAAAHGGKVVLVGQSWGGYFALHYARQHPDRVAGLALVAPSMRQGELTVPKPHVVVSEPDATEGAPPPLAEAFREVATVHQKWVLQRMAERVAPGVRSADHSYLETVLATPLTGEQTFFELKLAAPVLVVTGKQDSMVGYEDAWRLARELPRATFITLDRAAHALTIEQEPLYQLLLAEWLTRVEEHGTGVPRRSPIR